LGCFIPSSAESGIPGALDVIGWNYARKYITCRDKWPNLPLVYSESASAFSTRGYFDDFPMPSKKDAYSLFDVPHLNAFTSMQTHKRDFIAEYVGR
jgi:hypothetical protein